MLSLEPDASIINSELPVDFARSTVAILILSLHCAAHRHDVANSFRKTLSFQRAEYIFLHI
jgi:hypothetical protein